MVCLGCSLHGQEYRLTDRDFSLQLRVGRGPADVNGITSGLCPPCLCADIVPGKGARIERYVYVAGLTWIELETCKTLEFLMGKRPDGLSAPKRIRASAVPPSSPEHQMCSRVGTESIQELASTLPPALRTTMVCGVTAAIC